MLVLQVVEPIEFANRSTCLVKRGNMKRGEYAGTESIEEEVEQNFYILRKGRRMSLHVIALKQPVLTNYRIELAYSYNEADSITSN